MAIAVAQIAAVAGESNVPLVFKEGAREFTYTHSTLDQILTEAQAGGATRSFAYDRYGNQVEEKLGSTVERTYTWNGKNQLTGAWVRVEGAPGGGRTIEYAYDEQGSHVRRLLKVPGSPDDGTNYLTDTSNPSGYSQVLEERGQDGNVAESYACGTGGPVNVRARCRTMVL